MIDYVRTTAITWIAFLLTLVLCLTIWFHAYSKLVPTIEQPTVSEIVPSVFRPGDLVYMCRTFRINRPATIHVSWSLVATAPDGTDRRIGLGSDTIHRPAKLVEQCRPFRMPERLDTGLDWEFHTYVEASPIWPWPDWAGEFGKPIRVDVLPMEWP